MHRGEKGGVLQGLPRAEQEEAASGRLEAMGKGEEAGPIGEELRGGEQETHPGAEGAACVAVAPSLRDHAEVEGAVSAECQAAAGEVGLPSPLGESKRAEPPRESELHAVPRQEGLLGAAVLDRAAGDEQEVRGGGRALRWVPGAEASVLRLEGGEC